MPGKPLISDVAASADRLFNLRPLTATITSPAFSPARAAGEELKTRSISSPRLAATWVATDTPMPVKCGGALNSRYSLGLR